MFEEADVTNKISFWKSNVFQKCQNNNGKRPRRNSIFEFPIYNFLVITILSALHRVYLFFQTIFKQTNISGFLQVRSRLTTFTDWIYHVNKQSWSYIDAF